MTAGYFRCRNYCLNDGLCRLASDAIANGSWSSKILLSIVYLWTGRGPEINNGASAASGRRWPGPGTVPARSVAAKGWWWLWRAQPSGGRDRERSAQGGAVLTDRR